MAQEWTGINGDWATGGKTDAQHLRHAASHSAVIAGVEMRRGSQPIDVKAILGPDWDVRQKLANSSTGMTFVAVKKSSGMTIVKWDTLPALPKRRGVRLKARYLTRVVLDMPEAKVRNHVLGVCHFPPARYRARRWVMERYVERRLVKWSRNRGLQVALFTDNNEKPQRMAHRFHMQTDGRNIMAWLWTPYFDFSHVRLDRLPKQAGWSDHPDAVAVRA